ncbi:MAG: glutamate--tRNA ligase family protein, partial [Gemmatimonadales bacterium]
SRKDLLAGAPPVRHAEIRYPGRCRSRGLAPARGRGLRVIMEPGAERFEDLLRGPQIQDPSRQCGDMPVRDRLGNWTYQFAVTVDDWRQGVTLVIRGQDLLASTGRQIRLGRLLGRSEPPAFLHHPLILKDDGEKLSKANRDTGIRDLRAAGVAPGEVLGRAVELGGLGRGGSVGAAGLSDLVGSRLLGASR